MSEPEIVPVPGGVLESPEVPVAACPITGDFLPPNLRKHVDVASPTPLRMMAAKTLVPLSPSDMVGALFMLTFDPDKDVRDMAAKNATTLPDRILGAALRDEGVPPAVLGYFLGLLWEKDVYAEMLVLNASTPDEAVAVAAARCSLKSLEIIGQNQLRLLRHEDIIRQLTLNPNGTGALVDGVCDFAVRSGVVMEDVPQIKEARIRLFGPDAAEKPPDPGPTAQDLIEEYKSELTDEGSPPMEEGKRITFTQRIMKMNISQKIKLATVGNKEARSLLLRDTNKLVAVAAIRSPRITDGEVQMVANNRAAQEDVLRVIYQSREWTKLYPIKLALVKNPKTPLAISMKFLSTLRETEIKDLARNKNVPGGIQSMAKKMVDKKNEPKKEEK